MFTPATLSFLDDLARDNRKDWFDANRDRYERDYVAVGKAFLAEVGERVGMPGKMMRIFRDTRFSKDKTPYKPHLDVWFTAAPDGWGPGLFARLEPARFTVGVGCHDFDKDALARFREAAVRDGAGLRAAIGDEAVNGRTLKRFPKGWPEDPFMLHTALWVHHEGPVPADPVAHVLARYERWKPLHAWLTRAIAG